MTCIHATFTLSGYALLHYVYSKKDTSLMALPADLRRKIEAFLEHPSQSEGGYAPVAMDDLEQLADILRTLVGHKYEEDPDGDLPVAFELCDRTRYQRAYFSPIPHLRDEEYNDLKKINEIMRAASHNVATANGQLEQASRTFDNLLRERLETGKTLTYGKRVFEVSTPHTDHSRFVEMASEQAEAYLRRHPYPVGGDWNETQAWEREANATLSSAMNASVRVSVSGGRSGKPRARLDFPCFDQQRGVALDLPQPQDADTQGKPATRRR